jgi:uncharacterized protein with HEPN domain
MMDDRLVNKLLHMRDAARQACAFVDGMGKAEFLADALTRDACCMNLIIIGEAAKRIIENWPDFAAEHSDFGLHRMTGMRNRVAHGYEDINFEVVWDTLVGELPALIERVEGVFREP